MRLERLTSPEELEWRERYASKNWLLGKLSLGVTLPEYGGGEVRTEAMHFGYYLQPLHLTVYGREEVPRILLANLAKQRPPVDFLELAGAGIRIPHAFPKGFTLEKVLRLVLQEIGRIPVEDEI
ncbi:MAG: hypothetical protein ABI718_11725 [Acidobacteriota bacterium]